MNRGGGTGNRLIWKFPLLERSVQHLVMPRGAKVRHVGAQDGVVKLWVEVEPDHIDVTRSFLIIRTGEWIPPESEYVGTTQVPLHVSHVYEVP